MFRIARPFGVAVVLAASLAAPVAAQERASEEAAVMAVVERLFDGMRAADTTMVRATFHPDARLVGTAEEDGRTTVRMVPVDRFVEAVGRPRDAVWDERIWDPEVRVDDRLATVWVPYAFYLGEELSHCGVDAFQLSRAQGGWVIVQIADTRRREGCDAPEEAKPGR